MATRYTTVNLICSSQSYNSNCYLLSNRNMSFSLRSGNIALLVVVAAGTGRVLPQSHVVRAITVVVQALVRRAGPGVVVQRQRATGPVLRTGQRVLVAVVGEVGAGEDHQLAEVGRDARLAALQVARPQLQVAAVLVLPVGVHVEKHIHAAVQTFFALVEVSVYRQEPSGQSLVNACTAEEPVGDDLLDARDSLQEMHEQRRLHEGEHGLRGGSHGVLVEPRTLGFLVHLTVPATRGPAGHTAVAVIFRIVDDLQVRGVQDFLGK